jgi:hypothetical protein
MLRVAASGIAQVGAAIGPALTMVVAVAHDRHPMPACAPAQPIKIALFMLK